MADEKDTTSDIDDWLDDLDDSDDFSGELDQDNIDALLDGSQGTEEAEPEAEEEPADFSGELDQSNIDALRRFHHNTVTETDAFFNFIIGMVYIITA